MTGACAPIFLTCKDYDNGTAKRKTRCKKIRGRGETKLHNRVATAEKVRTSALLGASPLFNPTANDQLFAPETLYIPMSKSPLVKIIPAKTFVSFVSHCNCRAQAFRLNYSRLSNETVVYSRKEYEYILHTSPSRH